MKHVDIRISDQDAEYFKVCARIRNISRRALFRRLFAVIANDKLVENILDDDYKCKLNRYEHKFKDV